MGSEMCIRDRSSRYLAGRGGGVSSEGSVVSMDPARAVSGPSPPHIAGRLDDRSPSQQSSSSRPVHNATATIRLCSFRRRSRMIPFFHIYVTPDKQPCRSHFGVCSVHGQNETQQSRSCFFSLSRTLQSDRFTQWSIRYRTFPMINIDPAAN